MATFIFQYAKVCSQSFLPDLQLKFSHYEKSAGLSDPVIFDIIQDHIGFIWLGTENGLNRFDGKYFVDFVSNPSQKKANRLPSNRITTLEKGSAHTLWIGTEESGICQIDTRSNEITQIPCIINDDTLSNLSVLDLHWDGQRLWVGTANHKLLHYMPKIQRWGPIDPNMNGRYTTIVKQLSDGRLIVGAAGKGLQQMLPVYHNWGAGPKPPNSRFTPAMAVQDILEDSKGRIWCGAWDNGLHELRPDGQIHTIPMNTKGLFTYDAFQIHTLSEVSEGIIWLGTDQGELWQFEPDTKAFRKINGLAPEVRRIKRIFVDRQGNTWIGTDQGLFFYAKSNNLFSAHNLPETRIDRREIWVQHFFQSGDSTMWIGTDKGLFKQSLKNGALEIFDGALSVSTFFNYQDRYLFIGTNKAVYKLDLRTEQLTLAVQSLKNASQAKWHPNDLIASAYTSIAAFPLEQDTLIWAAANGWQTVFIHPHEAWAAFSNKPPLDRRKYFIDAQQRLIRLSRTEGISIDPIFIKDNGQNNRSSLGGKYHYQKTWKADGQSGLLSNHVGDIVQESSDRYWLSSPSKGLYEFKPNRKPPFKNIPLPFQKMEGLILDQNGHIWVIADGALINYHPQNGSFRRFGSNEGLSKNGLQGKLYINAQGRIFAGGAGHWLSFHPDSLHVQSIHANIVLTRLSILDEDAVLGRESYQFSETDRNYVFGFSALEFAQPDAISYQYQLTGLSHQWVDVGHQQMVQFAYLPSGKYTFSARALSYDGKVLSTLEPVRFSVSALWYKSWWFQLSWISALLTGVYGLYKWRVRLRKRADSIRNQIARDLHDDLGSTLGSISIFSKAAQHNLASGEQETTREILDLIGKHSRESLSNMRDTIWSVNPENDQLSELVEKMEYFARNTLSSAGITLRLQIGQIPKNIRLNMNQRKNVFLIFKEIIYNLIKHSQSSTAEVNIQVFKGQLLVHIEDQGVGFDPTMAEAGNGLKNIHQRATDIQGILEIQSESGKGSKSTLKVKI